MVSLKCTAPLVVLGAALGLVLPAVIVPADAAADGGRAASAIAMRGAPDLPDDFTAFPYADPNAPHGGRLTLSLTGTFDSLNPFIVKGSPASFVRGYLVESLMARSLDEPFTLYPLIARSVTTDAARSFVEFEIDPRARFADGTPVTAQDVLFSHALMRDQGRPNHRLYYAKVAKAEERPGGRVRFTFAEPDPELPLIMGLMPVLSRAAVDPARFAETSLSAPLGTGPYKVEAAEAGASLTLSRRPDYWGRDLPANRGLYNFDTLRILYFRDANSEFEAFKKGLVDARFETDPGRWETGYDFPAARAGEVVREVIPTGTPKPYSALVFNTRRPVFADIRVRRALTELFDFEWLDRNFYHGLYARTTSFFQDSELSSSGRPADDREKAIIGPFAAEIVPEALLGTLVPPVSDGSGRDRDRRRDAFALLEQAGWRLSNGLVRREGTGEPLAFEIMVATRDQERLALAYASQLERAGITARVRFVDAVQFDARRNAYDFDMVPAIWSQSLSPGNEQAFYFGAASADTPGTRNYMGARSPAVDAAIDALVAARDEDDFIAAARALDRALLSGAYAVPLFHTPGQWLARWTRIGRPAQPSLYGTLPETWWRVPGR
ncbi:extracellular solute-binding protein [Xanthobacter pseudotagetidis]|uniref:extracellular solute-binding protein n=1 Tax=Xanthobacter pseudotagetidis TaxID=3119911 RepID=UPI00372D178E